MTVLPPDEGSSAEASAVHSPKRSYDKAFRTNAVQRAKEPGARIVAVADELGVSTSTLRRWVKAHDETEPAAAAVPLVVAREVHVAALPESPASTVAEPTGRDGHERPDRHEAPVPHDAPVRHDESQVIAMLDAILEMFPKPGALPQGHELDAPGPGARRDAESPHDRIPLHPGDDIFPALPELLPAYRFPLILAGLLGAVALSTVVPADYALRPAVLALHVLSLVVSFGAVLVIDWHGLLWLAGRRAFTESTRLAAGAGPLIWGGLGGLILSGALLHPDLSSPITVTKLVLVLAVAWNGAAMSALRRRLAQLPAYVKPADLPRRDWRLMMTATVISQIGWWGAILIGFVNAST